MAPLWQNKTLDNSVINKDDKVIAKIEEAIKSTKLKDLIIAEYANKLYYDFNSYSFIHLLKQIPLIKRAIEKRKEGDFESGNYGEIVFSKYRINDLIFLVEEIRVFKKFELKIITNPRKVQIFEDELEVERKIIDSTESFIEFYRTLYGN